MAIYAQRVCGVHRGDRSGALCQVGTGGSLQDLDVHEFGGEVEESAFLHRSSAVRNAIEEAQMKLASSEIRPSRKALLLPLAVVMAMEEMVISDDRLPFSRAYAWYRLVKIWAGLRFDDTKGIPNRSMELRENYLVGIIHKSKTSGPGKRVLQLPF